MKRLVVCCDGTWQSLDNAYPTNVLKLAQAVSLADRNGVHQVVYYDDGVGAGKGTTRLTGGAFGAGIDRKIQNAYRFLSLNHAPGDEIYLFGFSRGAYTVRSLSGLIYNSGLLDREHVRRIGEAYELYRDRADVARPSGEASREFRQRYGDRVDITALCCWDTVGSLGVPDLFPVISDLINERYRFFDTTLNNRVRRAFHALAVDETREVFDVTPMRPHADRGGEQVTEAWFPGDHGCVGGGRPETRGLSDTALEWMMDQVAPLGLAVDKGRVEDGIHPDPSAPFTASVRGIFRYTGIRLREIGDRFETLHEAVRRRWREVETYEPPNLKPFEDALETWRP
jgi:uncharacterized protein (DUF2235 family)